MLAWLKRLFGFAEEVVTLAERQRKANELAAGAVSLFEGIVDDLNTAALDLKEIAEAATHEASLLISQANEATAAAEKNLSQAAKIAGLLD